MKKRADRFVVGYGETCLMKKANDLYVMSKKKAEEIAEKLHDTRLDGVIYELVEVKRIKGGTK